MNQIPPEAGRLHIRSLTPEDYPLYDQWEADLHRMHVEARPDLFCPLEHPVPQEQYWEELNDCHELRLLADGKQRNQTHQQDVHRHHNGV